MQRRLDPGRRLLPVILGILTLAGVVALLVWDIEPRLFPAQAHGLLGAFPLAMIAIAYLVYEAARGARFAEMVKASLLAAAFLLWAANQFWPDARCATLLNDLAIALFVFDIFLVMAGWPSTQPDGSFADTGISARARRDA